MKTAMELLFQEFEALSKVSRDAKDEHSANLIDFLCERKQIALEKEKEQIMDAYQSGHSDRSFEKYNPYFYEENYNQNK